ncbi:EamA family transporter [Pedobacter yulinensis]|uniref:EamA family transporter n=1 Tax=Pedobacter yulinensis TaxID=2126353 RepID=A0A2T3HPE2_9SPHI|nr:DMT family transporter [Pedobacter yulinensis]PST84330.1 EamA family transporter [Pedobacter yulinensis]
MTKYSFMVFAGACSYGILSTLVKLAYGEGYHTAEITFVQALGGMSVLWGLHLFKRSRSAARPRLYKLMLAGALIGFTSWLYYRSVQYISASAAAVLLMQFTWMSVLLERISGKRAAQPGQYICMIAILGGSLLAAGPGIGSRSDLRGIAFALASALTYALYIVSNTFFSTETPALTKSAWMMTGSAVLMLVLVATGDGLVHADAGLLKWGLLLALFGTILPPLLFSGAISRIGAGSSAILMTAELPVAILSANLLLSERISHWQWLGIGIMLTAIAALNLVKKQA